MEIFSKETATGLFFYGCYMLFSTENRLSLLFYHQVLIPIDRLIHYRV